MDCNAFADYSNSQAAMEIMFPNPGLEEPSSEHSHNLLNKQTIDTLHRFVCLFNRLWDCPEGGSSNPGIRSIMSIVASELEKTAKAMHSLHTPLPPDLLIREAEETFENNIRVPQERQ